MTQMYTHDYWIVFYKAFISCMEFNFNMAVSTEYSLQELPNGVYFCVDWKFKNREHLKIVSDIMKLTEPQLGFFYLFPLFRNIILQVFPLTSNNRCCYN